MLLPANQRRGVCEKYLAGSANSPAEVNLRFAVSSLIRVVISSSGQMEAQRGLSLHISMIF